MGMIGNIIRVTNDELKAYLENSSLLENRIYDTETKDDGSHVDIDKAWEGILFLLTGAGLASLEHPMGKALFSGQLINEDQDLGYGPAHYLTPEQVKEIDAELSSWTIEELSGKFDAAQMTELGIYPDIWEE